MPKIQQIESTIHKIYRRNALNLSLFAYVLGVRSALHTITIPQAVDMFMQEFGLDDDTFNRASAITTFNRMQKELLITKKSE